MAEIIGLNATIQVLRQLPKTYAKERKKALKKAAKPLVGQMKKNLTSIYSNEGRNRSRRTGNLRKSIKILSHIKNKGVTYVGPNVRRGRGAIGPHGHFLEYGTVSKKNKTVIHQAKPFVKPAYNTTKGQVTNILEAETKKILAQYKTKYERQ